MTNQNPTVLLAEFAFNGGYERRYVATETWYSQKADSIGVREYVGRISEEPTFKTSLTCVLWGGSTATSIGALSLIDIDGQLTDWLSLDARDAVCVLRLTRKGESYDTSTVVARCIVDEIKKTDGGLQVTLRGRDSLLDKPLQSRTYALPGPDAALVGTLLPVTLGFVKQAEPVLYSATGLEYRLNDGGPLTITDVFSGGSPATGPGVGLQYDNNADGTGFVMSVQPGAKVLCNLFTLPGIGADLTAAAGAESQFDDPANWTAGVPEGWTVSVSGSPAYTITQAATVGAVFAGKTDNISSRTLTFGSPLSAGFWYLLVGKIARNRAGSLKLVNGGGHVISTEGEFTVLFFGSGKTLGITHGGVGDIDITVESLYLFEFSGSTAVMTDVLSHLAIARGGFLPAQIDMTDYVAREGFDPQIGFTNQDPMTVREAINRCLDSVTGWAWVGPDGIFRIGRLRVPNHAASAQLTASRLNIVGAYPIFAPDYAPGLSDTFAGQKNETRYTDGELAGITFGNQAPFLADYRLKLKTSATLRRAYRHAIGAPPVTTFTQEESDLQAEADRVGDIYAIRPETPPRLGSPGFWTFQIAMPDDFSAAAVHVDQLIRLDGTNPTGANLFGAHDGLNAIIIEIGYRARDNVLTITAWTTA